MNLTAVVVDDEMLTVQSLTKLISSCNPNIEVIGSATNGEEAFKLIKQLRPDIALVDISMPLLNGIELIKLLKTRNIQTKIVVISAYREFEYAREALNYGAYAYLLKPINVSNVKNTLLQIQEMLEDEQKIKEVQVKYGAILPELANKLIKKFVREEIGLKEFDKEMRENGLKCLKAFRVCKMKGELLNTKRPVIQFVKEILQVDVKKEVVLFEVEHDIVFILPSSATEHSLINQIKYKAGVEGIQSTLYISKVCHSYTEMLQGYKKIENLILAHFYHNFTDQIVWCESYEKTNYVKKLYNIDTLKVKQWILKRDKINISNYIKHYHKQLRQNTDVLPEYIYRSMYEIILLLKSDMQVTDISLRYMLDNLTIDTIKKIYTLDGLVHYIKTLIEQLFEEEIIKEQDKVILMVKDYCNKHYGEDIGLEDISRHVSMSKNYFCNYFKKYTGDSFIQYLKRARMSIAKQKLRETNEKIVTIAKEVGYINDSHFCKLFKEEEGISPAGYRKKYS